MGKTAESERKMREHLVSEEIARALLQPDDGQAAQMHLDAGHPIYYCDDRYPDAMIRKWPDGRREIINVDDPVEDVVIGVL